MSFQEEKIQVTDKFEVTGFSYKPFYKLTQDENNALNAKTNKNIIFFKATLIKADEPNNHPLQPAIITSQWVDKNRDQWAGLPITMGHPPFKNLVNMSGSRPEGDIVRDILKVQEDYSVGRIMKVEDHPTDKRLRNFYGYVDNPALVKGVQNGETLFPRYGSPYFWHLGKIDRSSFDKKGNFIINDHAPVHWAFVKDPAMGQEIEVHAMCTGEEMACLQKMQSNSIGDDTHWKAYIDDDIMKGIVYTCPAAYAEEVINNRGLDKSFYVDDPLSSIKMSSNSTTNNEQETKSPEQKINDFMTGGKPDNVKGSMPPTNNPDGEGQSPNPGEQVDRNKEASSDTEDKNKEETPEEKNKLETMIEEVRAKAEKAAAKKSEKTLAEKDATISKLEKEIATLKFKDIEKIVNDSLPDDLYGGKEEDKKKAAEDREFYTSLAREKGMTSEQVSRILSRNIQVKELKVGIGSSSSSPKKGQANSASEAATPDQIKSGIREFTLSDKTTKTFVEDSKTTADESKKIKEATRNFLAGR